MFEENVPTGMGAFRESKIHVWQVRLLIIAIVIVLHMFESAAFRECQTPALSFLFRDYTSDDCSMYHSHSQRNRVAGGIEILVFPTLYMEERLKVLQETLGDKSLATLKSGTRSSWLM